jgi:uncharacterized protein
MKLKRMLLVPAAIVAVLQCSVVSSSVDPEVAAPTSDEIRRLLQANGSTDAGQVIGSAVAQQIISNMHRANPSLSTRADVVITEVTVSYVRQMAEKDHFTERLIPIYAKYLTQGDVRDLTEFYHSRVGRKLVSVTPALSLESAQLGEQWVTAILPGLQIELQDKLKSERLL